jgi:hypothetical protein
MSGQDWGLIVFIVGYWLAGFCPTTMAALITIPVSSPPGLEVKSSGTQYP